MNSFIKKNIEIAAPVTKVWQALTDYKKFGEWFGVTLEGPFSVGKVTQGQITIPGYEKLRFEAVTQKIEPENYFSYTWHPCPTEENYDYSSETPTLVEFKLEVTPKGTLLKVTESGFDKLPERRRDASFRKNSEGWEAQLNNIGNYVTAK